MKLERNILRSVIFGLGLSKESIEIDGPAVIHSGVEHRLFFWRLDALTRQVWLRDVHAIGSRTAVYPILVILAFISLFNVAANLGEWMWYWSLPIWRIPYGIVLTWIFELFFSSNAHWLISHFISFALYSLLIWFTRRRSIQIEYGGRTNLCFSVHGLPKNQVDAFLSHLMAEWKRQKAGNPPSIFSIDKPQHNERNAAFPQPAGETLPGNKPSNLSAEDVTQIITQACIDSLGIKEHQMESSFQEMRIPPGDIADLLDDIDGAHGFYISPMDREGILCAKDIIRCVLKSKY